MTVKLPVDRKLLEDLCTHLMKMVPSEGAAVYRGVRQMPKVVTDRSAELVSALEDVLEGAEKESN